jgi:hypothetical protein
MTLGNLNKFLLLEYEKFQHPTIPHPNKNKNKQKTPHQCNPKLHQRCLFTITRNKSNMSIIINNIDKYLQTYAKNHCSGIEIEMHRCNMHMAIRQK